ncbi:MAG: GAF domain-containing protein, partial [Chloroflexota bacterium]
EAELRNLESSFDAVFGLSDSIALAVRDARKKLGLADSKTLIVGINGDPLALAAIADGSMCATVDTPALELGGQVVDLACKAARGEPLPVHFGYKPKMVTSENVAEVALNKLSAIANLPTLLVGVNRQLEQNRSVQLETSAAINRRIGSLLDRRQLSQEIAKLIQANYGYDRVLLFLWSRHEQLLVLEEPEATSGSRVCLSLEESGLMGEVMRRNEPIFIPDTYHSNRFPPDPKWPDAVSRVILPIHLGSEILGVLDLHSHRPILHLRLDLVGLQSLADQLGIAMRNADLYNEAVQARKTAEKADQLKTRLLANVSHELRAPMNVILGYTQAALSSPNPYHVQLPEPLIRDLRSIFISGDQLMRLINDLLDLSRAEIDALEIIPETIETRSFLDEVFHTMADTAGASDAVDWRLCLPKRLPVIEADPIRLRQIILNLLHNASKFTQRGEILLGAEIEPPYLHLWVRDTGPGIPLELQERIFEPFVSIEHRHRRPEGIGLGLSITRRLVALHGGSMTLESRPHHGSTFHVYLPLPSLSGRPLVQPCAAVAPVLVLLSGNEQVPEALTELCRRRGLSIRRPGDDPDALLAEVQPAALAWDLASAKPKDWTLIQRLRSHPQWCRLPFLVFGHESGGSPELAAGMTNIVTKPVAGRPLIEILEALHPAQAVGPILVVDDDPEARRVY